LETNHSPLDDGEQHKSLWLLRHDLKGEFFMPKNKFQEVIFTIIMVIPMVYGMICYNIAVNMGGFHSFIFLEALNELWIMAPIAFVIEILLVGRIAQWGASKVLDMRTAQPFLITVVITGITLALMCPIMSLFGTLFFQDYGSDYIACWLQTAALAFPMAFFWQYFFCGPFARFVFRLIFCRKKEKETK
jgi:hypothetical protein